MVKENFTFHKPLLCQRSKSFCTPQKVSISKENFGMGNKNFSQAVLHNVALWFIKKHPALIQVYG
jgi:hypothetical protein